MEIEYDATESRRNAKRRGLHFADYGEQRVIAYGLIRGRMHVCVYTLRRDAYRIISLRKANRREVDAYSPYVLR